MASNPAAPLLLSVWNEGLFCLELLKEKSVTSDTRANQSSAGENARKIPISARMLQFADFPGELPCGTWEGTKMDTYTIYKRCLDFHRSWFEVNGFEPAFLQASEVEEQRKLYTFKVDGLYPPHLQMIPPEKKVAAVKIFDGPSFRDTLTLVTKAYFIHDTPFGDTIAKIQENHRARREKNRAGPSRFDWVKLECLCSKNATISDRDDWYTDAVFAQSQFTGTNPTTIRLADSRLINEFRQAANEQANDKETTTPSIQKMAEHLQSDLSSRLYVQDNSYFRDAVGAGSNDSLRSGTDKQPRYACASVSLFELNSDDGRLHPLAIVIDYRRNMSNSVVIFNRRLGPDDPTDSEANDWPWRYAKNCALVSDWLRHELAVHLTNTHFVEEAVLVAAQRSFPCNHPVLDLLIPHWQKTLSLNALARSTLVPDIISKLVGVNDKQMHNFINHAYKSFDFTGLYVPKDLEARGFPLEHLHTSKFRNYAYAKNISAMWKAIHTYVSTVIGKDYRTDEDVAHDPAISLWVAEMRGVHGANLTTFPQIKTISDLVDAITMCIHIASPQHTAVNYLQEYYQSFVISKPPAVCAPLPMTLAELQGFTEKQMMEALPINRLEEWLLASHLPHLLSVRVSEDESLKTCILSQGVFAERRRDNITADAAFNFVQQLRALGDEFRENSRKMTPKTIRYDVMDPEATAVSILI